MLYTNKAVSTANSANEAYLAEYANLGKLPTDTSYLPAIYTSFSETAMYLIEAAQNEINDLFKFIGNAELESFKENYTVVVYEEGSELWASIKEKAAKVWNAIWSKIKGAYEALQKFFTQKKDESISKRKALLDGLNASNIPDDAKFNYNTIPSFEKLDEFRGATSSRYDKVMQEIKSKLITHSRANKPEEVNEYFKSNMCDRISGGKDLGNNLSEMAAYIKKFCEGDSITVDGKWAKSNIEEIKKVLKDCAMSKVKESYKNAKDAFAKAKNEFNSYKADEADKFKVQLALNSMALLTKHAADMAAFDVEKKRLNVYMIVAKEIISKANKYTNESVSMIESAFNW